MDPAGQVRVLAGRYRLDAVIGRGGMGTVWRARDQTLNRDVAVKEIVWATHLDEEHRDDARRRAIREAQLAAQLNHPNVVRIYDVLASEDRPWIVMEFVPYRSLRDIVRDDGPLAPGEAAKTGLGVLAALGAAHAQGILHRDVKPGNVLIGPDGRVVLTDFGIARAADSSAVTTSGAIVGSPSYISPERARGEQAGPPGDMWGLGATLYAAVEGRPPFERDSALLTLAAVVADDPEPASRAGPLWPVISGLLRKDPGERLGGDDAGRMLRGVAHGSEGVAHGPATVPRAPAPPDRGPLPPERGPALPDRGPARPGGRPRGRWPAVAIAGAAAVVAIGAAVTVGLLMAHGSPRHGPSAQGSPSPASSSPASPPAPARSLSPSASPPGSSAAGAGGYGALPAGFYRFTNSTGFSLGVPRGWGISHSGHYVYITDPANAGVYLLIDQSDHPKPDPLADWEQQQANRAGSYPGYHLIRLESVRYPQAEKAADWEFTYNRDGVPVHILNRNVLANARHAYALYWSTPASDWSADYHYFQAFAATFRPAP